MATLRRYADLEGRLAFDARLVSARARARTRVRIRARARVRVKVRVA